jgi:hypothetical protein
VIAGLAAIVFPLDHIDQIRDSKTRIALAFLEGSMWLIIAGSAFYVGMAYPNGGVFLAVAVATFCASLFIPSTGYFAGRFGYATSGYVYFLGVNYIFFIRPVGMVPIGILLVALLDYVLEKHPSKIWKGVPTRYPLLVVTAFALRRDLLSDPFHY